MKISLRKPKMSDLKEFHKNFNDKELAKQLSDYPFPLTIEKAKKNLEKTIKKNERGEYYEFVILANKKFCGFIVLEKPSRDKKTFTLGYAIGRKYWNKGIATEAVRQMINFGFKELKLKKIIADNDEDNPASGRVLEKNEFRFIHIKQKTRHDKSKKVNVLFWEKKK